METDSSSQQDKRRGFSLVESAIVLAVVGLVIGGIWWAASAISTAREVSDIKEYVLYLQSVTQKYSRIWMPTGSNAYGSWLAVENILDKTKPLPGNFHWYIYTYNGVKYYYPTSANNLVYVLSNYTYDYSSGGTNYSGGLYVTTYFYNWDKGAYEPRPAVCAGLVSWGVSLASSRHVYLYFYDKDDTRLAGWDSQSGTAPPSTSLCKTAVLFGIDLW